MMSHTTTISMRNNTNLGGGYQDFSGENDADYAPQQQSSSSSSSNSPPGEIGSDSSTTSSSSPPPKVDTARFPAKLHRMLTSVAEEGLDDIVSWQPHGRCFLIRNKAKFIEKVMPKWFYQLKFVSFQRQLNLFGFKKIYNQGPDKGGIYHPRFLQGMPHLASSIQRSKTKGSNNNNNNSHHARKSTDGEPDFFSLPSVTENQQQRRSSSPRVSPLTTASSYHGSPTVAPTTSTVRAVSINSNNTEATTASSSDDLSSSLLEPRPIGPRSSFTAQAPTVSQAHVQAALLCQQWMQQQQQQQQANNNSMAAFAGVPVPPNRRNSSQPISRMSFPGVLSSSSQQSQQQSQLLNALQLEDLEPTPFQPGTSAVQQQQQSLQQQLRLFQQQQQQLPSAPKQSSFGFGS